VFHIIILFIPSSEHRKKPVPVGPKETGAAERRYQAGVFSSA
ncbi:hypothetical protein N323_02737, partial [Cathartes aura]